MELIEITKDSASAQPVNNLTELAKEVMSSTAGLYAAAGYV